MSGALKMAAFEGAVLKANDQKSGSSSDVRPARQLAIVATPAWPAERGEFCPRGKRYFFVR
ncbi:hypothetical protein ACXIVK_04545 [Paraburkholderia caledonica]